ncbi:protein Loquacious [Chironomus tepperi]|uniref:protein Loquacious n=1 Tax=Chironomus tepperi TaxID=113505 RepID=UPI00391F26B5
MNKTPISLLTELCTQKKVPTPVYEDLDVNDLTEQFKKLDAKFFIKCMAFGRSAIGASMTKKLAKHTAAEKVLKKLRYEIFSDDEDDDIVPNRISNSDHITELLNFCVQKNFHKPEFNLVEDYGPTHCPTFTYECVLDSISRKASDSNKKSAKQKAAKYVLNILKLSYPDHEKKVMIVNDENNAKEEARRKITTYLDLKSRNKVDKMGSTLSNRHKFFLDYKDHEFIDKLKEILLKNIPLNEKYEKFLQELKTEWDYDIRNFGDLDLKIFELFIQFDQFTVNLVSKEEDLKKTIIEYFMSMLHLTPIQHYECERVLTLDDIQLVPLK